MAIATLPSEKSAATKRWVDQKFLMLGQAKVGKSAFCACGDKTLFLETEPGLNHLSVMKVPVRCWDDFIDVCGQLYLAQKAVFPYDTLVIDTYDRLVEYVNEEVISLAKVKFSKVAENINTVGDVPEGVGWFMAQQLMASAVNKLTEFPAAIVFVSHVASREVNDGTRKINKETISVGGQMGTKMLHWADHTLHVRAKVEGDVIRRIFRTKPMEAMEAGSRGNVVPDGFKLEEPLVDSYKKFRALFE